MTDEMKDWKPIDESCDFEPEFEKEIELTEEEYKRFKEALDEIDPAYKELYEEFERL